MKKFLILTLLLSSFSLFGKHHGEKKTMKAFMITGGCCHDYKNQKNIISEGINERVPTKWDIFFEMDEKKSKAKLSQKGWADGYDYIVYNHCFAHEKDAEFVNPLLIFTKLESRQLPYIVRCIPIIGVYLPKKERRKPGRRCWVPVPKVMVLRQLSLLIK